MARTPEKDDTPRGGGARSSKRNLSTDHITESTEYQGDQFAQFARVLWNDDDIIELRAFYHDGKRGAKQKWIRAARVVSGATTEWISSAQAEGRSVYVGVNPRRCVRGAKEADVALARAVCVDIEDTSSAAVLLELRGLALPEPSIIVQSGGGVHLYWLLEEPLLDLARWRAIQLGLIRAFRAVSVDNRIYDPPRVMRVPGTLNVKRGAPATLERCEPERQYSVLEFPTDETRLELQAHVGQERQGDNPPVPPANPAPPVTPATPVSPAPPVTPEALTVFESFPVTQMRQRRNMLMRIVPRLKFHPEHGACGPRAYVPAVRAWHRKHAGKMSGDHSADDSVFEFLRLWKDLTVHIYPGIHAVGFELASRHPAPGCEQFESPGVRLLASACYHLDRLFGGVPFGLSCHVAGNALGIPPTTAHKRLNGLCDIGWIEKVEDGRPGPPGNPAARYRFIGNKPCINARISVDCGDEPGE